jgi:Flp pilus assembly protein CpaB
MRRHRPTRLLDLFDGAPVAAPALLDRVSERWWSLTPRARTAAAAVLGLAALTAGTINLVASPWGAPVTVLVARHDLAVGQTVAVEDLRRTDWPAELVPTGALGAAAEALGTVVAPVPAGSVVTDLHLGGGGLGDVVPEGHAAVALPADAVPGPTPGARLDVVGADLDTRGTVLASGAVVLAHDAAHVWVVVAHHEAAATAAAALAGAVTSVLVPP